MKLTQQQQDEIERSLWVVNTALKKQKLEHDKDLRQDAILYMCKCITNFDPKQGIKWTTYAYRNVFLFIRRTNAKRVLKNSKCETEDMWEFIENEYHDGEDAKMFVDLLKSRCSPTERKVLEYRLQGYFFYEIKKMLSISRPRIKHYKTTIIEKAKELKCKLSGNATNVDATDF